MHAAALRLRMEIRYATCRFESCFGRSFHVAASVGMRAAMKYTWLAVVVVEVGALHEWSVDLLQQQQQQQQQQSTPGVCVPPGQCEPPTTKYSKIVGGIAPGQQWNINGGFCGAFSVQHAALGAGAWISQDLVRKANRHHSGLHFMHGDRVHGYEVMPSNVAATAAALKLSFEEWDHRQPKPQATAYKRWLKKMLAAGNPVVWFPMCKGDLHMCYVREGGWEPCMRPCCPDPSPNPKP